MELEKKIVTDASSGKEIEIVSVSGSGVWYHPVGIPQAVVDEARAIRCSNYTSIFKK